MKVAGEKGNGCVLGLEEEVGGIGRDSRLRLSPQKKKEREKVYKRKKERERVVPTSTSHWGILFRFRDC